jgi:membrane associated rhomboid family serine protease
MFPYMPDISWEAHLFGFLAGIYFAIHYLKEGPPNDPGAGLDDGGRN